MSRQNDEEAGDSPNVPGATTPDEKQTVDLDGVVDPILGYTMKVADATMPRAPVRMPEEKDLTVVLVPMHQLEALDQERKDASLFLALAGTFLGGLLGIVVNAATSTEVSFDGKMTTITLLLLVVCALFAYLFHRSMTRATSIRSRWELSDSG